MACFRAMCPLILAAQEACHYPYNTWQLQVPDTHNLSMQQRYQTLRVSDCSYSIKSTMQTLVGLAKIHGCRQHAV